MLCPILDHIEWELIKSSPRWEDKVWQNKSRDNIFQRKLDTCSLHSWGKTKSPLLLLSFCETLISKEHLTFELLKKTTSTFNIQVNDTERSECQEILLRLFSVCVCAKKSSWSVTMKRKLYFAIYYHGAIKGFPFYNLNNSVKNVTE